MRQWVACIRDIFSQHDVEVREAEGKEKKGEADDESQLQALAPRKTVTASPLMSTFVDPEQDGPDGREPELMSLSEGLGRPQPQQPQHQRQRQEGGGGAHQQQGAEEGGQRQQRRHVRRLRHRMMGQRIPSVVELCRVQ